MQSIFIQPRGRLRGRLKSSVIVASVAVLALGATGCMQQSEPPKTSAPEAAKPTVEPTMVGAGKYDLAFNIAEKVTPQPYKVGVKAAQKVMGWIFPKPNMTLEMLKEIKAQLDEMDKKLDDIQVITSATYQEVTTLASNYAQNRYKDIVTDLNDAETSINEKYQKFYDFGIFPRDDDDLYSYAQGLCPDGHCSAKDKNIVWLLGGVVPAETQPSLATASQVCSSNQDPAELLNCFTDNMSPKRMVWDNLNAAYQDVLSQTKTDTAQDNKVVYYMAAMEPIVELELNLLSELQQLYYMNQMQLALVFAHPEFYVGRRSQFPFDLSDKEGEEGYKESLTNMEAYFDKAEATFKEIFGESKADGTRTAGRVNFATQSEYLNSVLGASQEGNALLDVENMGKNCWIEDFHAPNDSRNTWRTGSISALCKVTSDLEDSNLKRTYYTFNYYTDALFDLKLPNAVGVAYKDGKLKSTNSPSFNNVVDSSAPGGTLPSAWAWVAHTSGTAVYHLNYQKYDITLRTGSTFTKQVYNNRWSKMNNSTRPDDYSFSGNTLTYPYWNGPKFSSHAKPDGWTSSAYAVTENGRGYMVGSHFVAREYINLASVKDKAGQLIYLSCLLNDTTCSQKVDADGVTLTWQAPDGDQPTTVQLKTTLQQATCPDNSHTKGGGSAFKCDPNGFAVETKAPETIINPLAN